MAKNRVAVLGVDDAVATLAQLGVDISKALEAVTHAGAAVLQDGIEQHAPTTFDTARKTESKTPRRVRVVTGPIEDHWYVRFFEFGATPHTITAKGAQAITLDENLFRRSANHPGMAAQPFMRPAYDGNRQNAEQTIAARVRTIVNRSGK